MRNPAEPHVRVDTELRVPVATAQLVHFNGKGIESLKSSGVLA
jgi:hypothetical protein